MQQKEARRSRQKPIAVDNQPFVNHLPKSIDLFAGCGGMGLGMEKAGFKIVFANEVNLDAGKTYKHNFPGANLLIGDIRTINLSTVRSMLKDIQIDLIAAGLPCQGFSSAGLKLASDPRNQLFIYLIKFVKFFRPKIVVIENVKGMLITANGNIMAELRQKLTVLGYYIHVGALVSSDYGIPQNRERVFVIATSKDIPGEELFPQKKYSKVCTSDAISDLAFLGVNEKSTIYALPALTGYQKLMRRDTEMLYNHESSNHSAKIQKRFASIPTGMKKLNIPNILGTRKHTCYKLDPSKPSRTVTTLPDDLVHYKMNRIPTVREMARLQSFPDHFIFLGPRTTGGKDRKTSCPQYTQVGNAVPPLLAEAVFSRIAYILKKYYKQ